MLSAGALKVDPVTAPWYLRAAAKFLSNVVPKFRLPDDGFPNLSNNPLIYQRALLTSELRDIFRAAPHDPARSVVADEAVRKRFNEINSPTVEVARKPIGGHCPVCYEEMQQRQNVVWCRFSCGNNVHAECFQEWSKSKQAERSTVTCVLCRASWPQSDGRAPRSLPLGEEGYVNLGSLQHDLPSERPEYHDWRGEYYR